MEVIIEPKIELFKIEKGAASNNYYITISDHLSGLDELNIISSMVQRVRSRAIDEEHLYMAEELLAAAYNGVNFANSGGDVQYIYDFKS